MVEIMCALMMGGAMCLLFGVVYPVCAILAYPIYKRCGGAMSLREYISLL